LSPNPWLICIWGTLKNPFNYLYKSKGLFPGSTSYYNSRHNINVLIISHDCKLLPLCISNPKKSSIGCKAHWDICEMCYIRTYHNIIIMIATIAGLFYRQLQRSQRSYENHMYYHNYWIRILLVRGFRCQTWTFQHVNLKNYQTLLNVTQSNKIHTGMFAFGSQILVSKVCEYIKRGNIWVSRCNCMVIFSS
jgi:hypothetical protein